MKKWLLQFILLVSCFCLTGQDCLPTGIILTTQAEVDNFATNHPGCTEILGDLEIGDSDPNTTIQNLNGLSQLTKVSGSLSILGINGKDLVADISSLEGLSNITQVGGNVSILGCDRVQDLTGLRNLSNVGGGVDISLNDQINDLTGLENLTFVGGDFGIALNDNLTSFNGWNISSTGGGINIINNKSLTNLSGLESLTHIDGFLQIFGNDILQNLNGLNNLSTIEESLFITNNRILNSLAGLNNLISIGHGLDIEKNQMLASLGSLNSLTSIGNISIEDNDKLSSLTGLENAKEGVFGTSVFIRDNDGLTSLDGINFSSVIFLEIRNNSALTSLNGLSNLTEISFECKIIDNESLVDLAGLDNLVTTARLHIENNNKLISLAGLEKLLSIGQSGIANTASTKQSHVNLDPVFSILDNDALANLDALTNLSGEIHDINIADNVALENVEGLAEVTALTTGLLRISNNANLDRLTGLENINPSSIQNLIIELCPALSSCEIANFCNYLNTSTNSATISDNGTNCMDRNEVETACAAALPIQAITLSGKQYGNTIQLKWQATNQEKLEYMLIQYSVDSNVWETIGMISTAEPSSFLEQHFFIDSTPIKGMNYYQLKQVDIEGGTEYSNIISVSFRPNEQLDFYPNPAKDIIKITNFNFGQVYIFNSAGQLVKECFFDNSTIYLSDLPAGVYTAQIISEAAIHYIKIVKQ